MQIPAVSQSNHCPQVVEWILILPFLAVTILKIAMNESAQASSYAHETGTRLLVGSPNHELRLYLNQIDLNLFANSR